MIMSTSLFSKRHGRGPFDYPFSAYTECPLIQRRVIFFAKMFSLRVVWRMAEDIEKTLEKLETKTSGLITKGMQRIWRIHTGHLNFIRNYSIQPYSRSTEYIKYSFC